MALVMWRREARPGIECGLAVNLRVAFACVEAVATATGTSTPTGLRPLGGAAPTAGPGQG